MPICLTVHWPSMKNRVIDLTDLDTAHISNYLRPILVTEPEPVKEWKFKIIADIYKMTELSYVSAQEAADSVFLPIMGQSFAISTILMEEKWSL